MHTRRQKAQAVVELAIVAPILILFALGTLDFGRVFYANIGLVNATREGARRATQLAPATDSSVLTAVQATVRAEQIGLFSASVPSSAITLQCYSDRRTVNITDYPFQPVTPFIGTLLGDDTGVI